MSINFSEQFHYLGRYTRRHGRIKQRIERFTNDGSQKTKPRQQELPKIVAASLTTDRPA